MNTDDRLTNRNSGRLALRGLCAFIAWAVLVPPVFGDALDEIQRRGTLIWGGDQEGGAPFVFPDPEQPARLIGFEVELAEMLAGEFGVKAKFKQGQWENVPQMLGSQIDIALNGFERTPARLRDYDCSRPYYAFGLQLMARADGPLKSWKQLASAKPDDRLWQIGILGGSQADTYLADLKADEHYAVDVSSYNGNTDAMQHVQDGRLDATVADDCVANYYIDRFGKVRLVGSPVEGGYYVILMAKGEDRLLDRINAAIGKLIADGRLKELYDRWNMDGRTQMLALRNVEEIPAAEYMSFWEVINRNMRLLLEGAAMTVFLSVVSFPLAIAIGIGVAVGRMYGPWFMAKPLGLYVEVIRGTPLLLQLYAIFFLLPKIGLALPALVAAIAGLAINYSAYEAEIYRAGLQAIPRGQTEAALALGMTRAQAIQRIVLPQAIRIVIPPVTNDFIALFKDTSVCSVITVVELTKRYSVLALSTGAIVELAILTSILYLMMSLPLSLFARWNERRLAGELQVA